MKTKIYLKKLLNALIEYKEELNTIAYNLDVGKNKEFHISCLYDVIFNIEIDIKEIENILKK